MAAGRLSFTLLALAALAVQLCAVAAGQPEPPRGPTINGVAFSGNAVFDEARLRTVLQLPRKQKVALIHPSLKWGRADLEKALGELRLFYQRQGYFDAEVESEEVQGGSATIRIREGAPCTTASVDVTSGGEPLAATPGGHPLKVGEIFTADAYEQLSQGISRQLREDGHPFPEVEPRADVDLATHSVAVTVTVKPGVRAAFGPVTFEGPARMEDAILRRALAFKPGDPYRQSALDESMANLYKLGLFDSVSATLDRGGDSAVVPVHIKLREGKAHRVRLGLGYATDEGVRETAGWETVRVSHRVLALGALVWNSEIETRATAYLKRPYFTSPKSTLFSSLTYERNVEPSFTYQGLRWDTGLEVKFDPRLTGRFFGSLERVLQITPDQDLEDALAAGATDVATIASATADVTWNTTGRLLGGEKAPMDPERGVVLAASAEPSFVLDTGVSFTKTLVTAKEYFNFGHGVVLGLKLKLGGIFTDRPVDVPLSRRFYAGGAYSIRGYAYDTLGPLSAEGALLGGNGLVEGSAELRFPIREGITGVTFVDAGNATTDPYSLRDAPIYSGAGMGVRFKTPVGPIGMDIAWKLRTYARDSSGYQLYFFVGYAF